MGYRCTVQCSRSESPLLPRDGRRCVYGEAKLEKLYFSRGVACVAETLSEIELTCLF